MIKIYEIYINLAASDKLAFSANALWIARMQSEN